MPTTLKAAWVHENAYAAMLAEADATYPDETGGILVGYWDASLSNVVVASIIGPGPLALHSYDSFVPDAQYQEKELSRVYYDSGRLFSYLGDWHTHPNSSCYLSRADRKTLRRIANSAEARAPAPIMAVIASGRPWDLAMWSAVPRRIGGIILTLNVVPLAIKIYTL